MRARCLLVLMSTLSWFGVVVGCTSSERESAGPPENTDAGAEPSPPASTPDDGPENEGGSPSGGGTGGDSQGGRGGGGSPPEPAEPEPTPGGADAGTNAPDTADASTSSPGAGGSDGGSGAGPVDAGFGGTPPPVPDAGEYTRQHLLLDEGFEGDDPFASFSVGQACCDHTITPSSEQAREGTQSFRAEVRVGDPAVSSGYRAELTMPGISDEGDKWYGFAIYFESPTNGDEWTGTNGHFVQWHPDNSSGSASLGLWSYGEGWLVGLNPEGDGSADFESLDRPIEANRWHDIVLHVDWDGGIVQFWLNGTLEVDADGVDFASGPGQYMKLGINRWGEGPDGSPTEEDWVIYYDSYRIGDEQATYADVAP